MKFKYLFLLLLIILNNFSLNAQHSSIYNFIHHGGGFKTIATCSHPSNDAIINMSSVIEDDNNVYVKVIYRETFFGSNEETDVVIRKGFGDLAISDISVTKNYSGISAFYFTGKLKNMALSLYSSAAGNSDDVKKGLESKFYKSFKDFDGREFTLFMLNINHYNFLLSN